MPFDQNSVIEIVVNGKSNSGQNVLNVFHYRQSDTAVVAYDNDDVVQALNDFNANWISDALPILSVDYTYQFIRGRALTGTIANPTPPPANVIVVGEQADFVLPAPNPGLRAGEPLPSYSAIGIQKLSSRAGRNFRGGFRMGTIASADVESNLLEPTVYLPLVISEMSSFVAATLNLNFGANLWEMCIFSRTLALAAPPPFTLLRDLTAKVLGAKVNPFISSQVSRKQSPTQPT
jgi:hypothetical protein